MHTSKSPSDNAQSQPAAQQKNGAAVVSPQSEQLMQLEMLAEQSPQAGQLRSFAATIHTGTVITAQRKLSEQILASPRMLAQRKFFADINNSSRMLAQRKMNAGMLATVQRVEEQEALIQGKFEIAQRAEEDEPLQEKLASQASAQRQKESVFKSNNTGLPDKLKSGIESLSGMSMDHVKVHYNSSQPAQLNALAYAQGSEIHVAPGQEQHLPHEAWHVVQQAQGRVKPTMQMKDGVPVNDDAGLEHEADVMGTKAVQMKGGMRDAKPDSISFIVQKVDKEHAGKLEAAYEKAVSDQSDKSFDEKYLNHLSLMQYPFEDDSCDRPADALYQLKGVTVQLARTPYSISGPKSYAGLNNILYQLDGAGNIDFSNPSQYYIGNPYPGGYDPVEAGSQVDITTAVTNYGTGNRYQHFKEANQLQPQWGGVNGNSPAGLTWHHLTSKYDMHLVDRGVHSKHGHNGGVHIW